MKIRTIWVILIAAVVAVWTAACVALIHFKYSKSHNVVDNGLAREEKSSIQKGFQYLMIPNVWSQLGIDNLFDKRIYSADKQKIKEFFKL